MKNKYMEYIDIPSAKKTEICLTGQFVFDTNVLLNLYRFSEKTRNAFIQAIKAKKAQVWMPDHVAYEFLKNRCSVIYETIDNIDKVDKDADSFIEFCKNTFKIPDKDSINKLGTPIHKWISETKKTNLVVMDPSNDAILKEIYEIFDKKVGPPYIGDALSEVIKEGEDRYARKIPPGYKDANKKTESDDDNKYGDFIIWKQIIDYSKNIDKDIIFITDDNKEDWWQKTRGRTCGPKYELKREFYEKTNRKIIFYNTESFIQYCGSTADKEITKEIAKEISSIEKSNLLMKYFKITRSRKELEQHLDFQIENISNITYKIETMEYDIREIEEKWKGMGTPLNLKNEIEMYKIQINEMIIEKEKILNDIYMVKSKLNAIDKMMHDAE